MLDIIRQWKQKRYVQHLVHRGLSLGRNVYLNDGFFLDPSHCHLITIEDDVVFGPGVRLFAHDASTLKVIGKTRIGLVHLQQNCFLGAGVTVLPGVVIGENSIIGAGSVVTTDVPANEVWGGIPARKIMLVEEFRQRLLSLPEIDFPLDQFASHLLDEEKRCHMKNALHEHGSAFMLRRANKPKERT